jgi:hypothetical protein
MKTINVTAEGITAKLTLRGATVADSLRKGMLINDAVKNPLADPVDRIVQSAIYPRCMACLVTGTLETFSTETQPPAITRDAKLLTAAEFAALPEAIGDAWLDAALELNPSWDFAEPTPAEQEEVQKKD